MTIQKTDIKLLESERLTDTDDGGGRMTNVEVVDGQVNNLFNDISRLDRTIGRVSLRKCFLGVQTALNEVYAGSHAIITNPPADGGVHTTLFSTDDDDDERNAAKNRIESYTISGPVSRMRLYDRHIEGQRTLQVFQFPTDALPEVAEVYAISKGEGTGSEFQQFFRILKLAEELITFNHSQYSSYQMRVINLEIDTALQKDFEGFLPAPTEDLIDSQRPVGTTSRTVIRQTSVADASRYFGVVPIAEAVTANDVDIMADSIFTHIVPSTQAESPVTDVFAAGDARQLVQAGDQVELTFQASDYDPNESDGSLFLEGFDSTGDEIDIYVGSPILPGSLLAQAHTFGVVDGWVQDDGLGGWTDSGEISGVDLDYYQGRVRIRLNTSSANSPYRVFFKPAAIVNQSTVSKQIEITVQNRQLNYTDFLRPIPAPATLVVSYRSLGKWYTLRDDGDGSLIADIQGTGAGSLNYATGSVAVTVGFEPDVGSSVIFQWATPAHFNNRAGETIPVKPGILIKATEGHCEPNSVTISWQSGGQTKSVTDDGAGNLSGDGTGRILYQTGQAYFVPDAYPDPNVNISFTYDHGSQIVETFTPSKDGNGFISMNLGTTPVKPGSVKVSWSTTRTAQVTEQATNFRG